MMRALVGFSFVALLSGALFGQSAEIPPAFVIADVHPIPPGAMNMATRGGTFRNGRYQLLTATMVDLIRTAYGVDADKVLGGPSWLEWDRFDVIAKAPPGTSPDMLKLMLQALLADRFKLVLHKDTHPLPAFALIAGKSASTKLKASEGSEDSGCKNGFTPADAARQRAAAQFGGQATLILPANIITCTNVTMAAFADGIVSLPGAQAYIETNTVVDRTGLKGAWDFTLKYSPKVPPTLSAQITISSESPSFFDAVDKQLGLKLEPITFPTPVLMVDSVNQKPTANSPEVKTALPALPPAEFEVADIRPSDPGVRSSPSSFLNGRVSLKNMTLKNLITLAFNVNNDLLVGPRFLDTARFDLIAKLAPNGAPPLSTLDIDTMRPALRMLLADRFKLTTHEEDRPMDAYTLTAPKPRLKQADPSTRTACTEGPGADGRDPRTTNPFNSRLFTCHNVTMAQFAEELRLRAGGYVHAPILDATELDGGYDFTLNFATPGAALGGGGRGGANGPGTPDAAAASDPNGAISLPDAVSKQLGLKLELKKRPVPVLVIDHIEEKPTDN